MMAFKKNMVCSIKANGKILREIDNTVRLPFNSEYSILLKNLEKMINHTDEIIQHMIIRKEMESSKQLYRLK